uniref:Protein FMP32, mitochondrial n=2 Tax=Auxenochlorella protothecoides TaxID=3075 RepID=A0A1D2AFQ8_AUXPR
MSCSKAVVKVASALRRRCELAHPSVALSGLTMSDMRAGLSQRQQSSSLANIPDARVNPDGVRAIARNLLLDTLQMMRKFEASGMSREQAEGLTQHLTQMLCQDRDKLADLYVTKEVLKRSLLEHEANIAGFRAELLKSQELQAASFTRDTERLQDGLEKIRSEIRYEVDKLTASQRLDLNLEKGRIRDELQSLRDMATEMEIKVDKEVNSLKAAMEQSKNDTVKYVLGLMLALMTAGLGAARLVLH